MELTRRNRNTQAQNSPRNNNLASWAPLVSRLTKMAIEYAKSAQNTSGGTDGGGSSPVSTQYSRASTKRRREIRKNDASVHGIPRGPAIKVYTMNVKGQILCQNINGSYVGKWVLGNGEDTQDLFQSFSISTMTNNFLKAFTYWKYQKVDLVFENLLALTDGGYQAGVIRTAYDFTTPTPSYITAFDNSKMQSIHTPLKLSHVPTHHDGVVERKIGGEGVIEVEDRYVGTIMYMVAGGPTNSMQPVSMLHFTVAMSLWNN